ncbi:hypothetical protein ACIPC1_20765 [Streptomyces sp. NPDC087263]|uniref:hypothetical protein n=1 Tax=Streptomyces sp. NPDC087263 TaxID=3365773 RepID=UPI00382ED66C
MAAAVAVAPVALGGGCLATAPVCAAEIAEIATGGASGGSAVVGAGTVVAGASVTAAARSARGAEAAALGLRREQHVAEMIGGVVAKDAKGQDIKITMPNVGSSGLDAIGPNAEYVLVGGGAKAKNPADFGRTLKINKYAADEAGVPAHYYLDASNMPESAIKQAQKMFGVENVHLFNMPGE